VLRSGLLRAGSLGVIDAAAQGAWRELEAKLRRFVARRVGSATDVDDVVQDVFVRLQRGIGRLRDRERFGPWVYKVARSAILDHQRLAARRRAMEAGDVAEESAVAETAPFADEEDPICSVAPFVAALPSPYREALTLVELEGTTQIQAARRLGISVSGVKSRVQRGRARLRRNLEACCRIALDARGHPFSCEPRTDAGVPSQCCS
jgi:RNA polymerase sigma-70 factor (ECF subfamily)